MDMVSMGLGVSNVSVGMLLILVSMPLIRHRVPMNSLYGIRFKKSFESEENWYKINAYGGKQLILWSVPLVVFGVVTFFLPLEGRPLWIVLVACAPLIVLVAAVQSYRFARKL